MVRVPDQVPDEPVSRCPTVVVPEIDGSWVFAGFAAVWVSVARPEMLGEIELSVAVIVT